LNHCIVMTIFSRLIVTDYGIIIIHNISGNNKLSCFAVNSRRFWYG
jgi:hypothetical protein